MSLKTQGEQKQSTQRPPINSTPNAVVKGGRHGPFPFSSLNHNPQQKKVSRRSSKPIINWFQRKLAGTVKGKNSEPLPLVVARAASRTNSSRMAGRIVSSPVPAGSAHHTRQHNRTELTPTVRLKTVSLNGDDDVQSYNEDDSLDGQSLTRDSFSSPTSMLEADDDASVRPLPPSAPPSPAPSRSSSSYLSDPRTFRSIAASTKPTTVLSIDLPGNGMAHIAQVPVTPTTSAQHRFHHMRQSSSNNPHGPGNASVSFSLLQSQSSRLSSLNNTQTREFGPVSPIQAPLHTTHHPRNNPRPSSPPLDNASLLTLASSAYAIPTRLAPQGYGSAPPSAFSGGDSMSHFGGSMFLDESTSLFVPGDDDRLDERDVDASVRALRPRSSRRGSWGSEVSGWSAQIPQGPGTPPLSRERSLWTSNSVKSDEAVTENGKNSGDGVDTENQSRTDEGDIISQPPPSPDHTSQYEISIETSRGSTEAGDAIGSQEVSTRVCYRSASTDTVGHKANDKEDLSSAMLDVSIDNSEKSNSS